MAINCPNKNTPEWKKLVDSLRESHGEKAEDAAMVAFHRIGDIPTPEEAQNLLRSSAAPTTRAKEIITGYGRELFDQFKKWFYPEGRSKTAGLTATWLREQIGEHGIERERAIRTMDRRFRELHKESGVKARLLDRMAAYGRSAADVYLRGQTNQHNIDLMQWQDTGEKPKGFEPTPEDHIIADMIKTMNDRKVDSVRSLGTGKLEKVRQDYFRHQWTRDSHRAFSQAIKDAFAQGVGGDETDLNKWTTEQRAWVKARTQENIANGRFDDTDRSELFTGKAWLKTPGSLKKRTFNDVQTGIDFGLEPVSYNPLDIAAGGWDAMDKYVASHRVKDALKESGASKYVKLGGIAPRDMVPMANGEVYAPPQEGGIGPQLAGHWYVEKTAGQVINNYLSPTIWSNPLYKGYMGSANTLNQFQLGISAFHAGFISMEGMISHGAYGIKTLVNDGDPKKALKIFSEIPSDVYRKIKTGHAVLNALAGMDSPTWAMDTIKYMEMAGARTLQDRRLFSSQTDEAFKAWDQKKYLEAAARTPFAFVEQTARPIMEGLVPRM